MTGLDGIISTILARQSAHEALLLALCETHPKPQEVQARFLERTRQYEQWHADRLPDPEAVQRQFEQLNALVIRALDRRGT